MLVIFWSVLTLSQESPWECHATHLNFVEIEWQIRQNSFALGHLEFCRYIQGIMHYEIRICFEGAWWTVYIFVLSHFSFQKTILALYPTDLNHIYINTSGFVCDFVSMSTTAGYSPYKLSLYPWHCVKPMDHNGVLCVNLATGSNNNEISNLCFLTGTEWPGTDDIALIDYIRK